MFSRIHKSLPIINTVISISALSFQMFVLYPWHKELSNEFKELKQQFTINPEGEDFNMHFKYKKHIYNIGTLTIKPSTKEKNIENNNNHINPIPPNN